METTETKPKKKKLNRKDIELSFPDLPHIEIFDLKSGAYATFQSYSAALYYIRGCAGDFLPLGYQTLPQLYLLSALLANKKFNKLFKIRIYTLSYQN